MPAKESPLLLFMSPPGPGQITKNTERKLAHQHGVMLSRGTFNYPLSRISTTFLYFIFPLADIFGVFSRSFMRGQKHCRFTRVRTTARSATACHSNKVIPTEANSLALTIAPRQDKITHLEKKETPASSLRASYRPQRYSEGTFF